MRRLIVDAASPSAEAIGEAASLIASGGVVAVPTDTLYGLAADPFSADAVERVFAIKGREAAHALPLIAADADQVAEQIGALGPIASRLAAAFWPGPLTLLLAAPTTLADAVSGGTGRVGVRVPAHAVARAICRAAGRPVTATSANVSGEPASADPDVVARALGDRVGLLVDAGRTPGGPPSTIVDVTGTTPRLVRAGAIEWEEVLACASGA